MRFLLRLHRDQSGTISIASVFAMMLLAFLLGMVINSGLQVDQKIRMQNAADASAYSSGVVLARGMNTLAFTNHLLCDVFALTAFMREARDRSSESLAPRMLAAWQHVAPVLGSSSIPKFSALGQALGQKVPLEQEMVANYSEWAAASSEMILPMLEEILQQRMIPEFQRTLVATIPALAQRAADDIARKHGLGREMARNAGGNSAGPAASLSGGGAQPGQSTSAARTFRGVLWRTDVDPVGGQMERRRRTLPVVDPVMDDQVGDLQRYQETAREQRRRLAHRYLADWNAESLALFDEEGKLSQFSNLWRGFTCAQLDWLLEDEYPDTNLPHVIRTPRSEIQNVNDHLERDFTFVGLIYSQSAPELLPGLFQNPMESDPQAFAQIMLFVPRARLVKGYRRQNAPPPRNLGGVPGDLLSTEQAPPPGGNVDPSQWFVVRQNRPQHWDLLNQNWTVQLTPGRAKNLVNILRTPPQLPGMGNAGLRTPQLRGVTSDDVQRVNSH